MLPKVLEPRRNRLIAGGVAVAFLVGGVALALSSGGDEEAPPTTTTSTTVASTTTTAKKAPPIAPLLGVTGDFGNRLKRPALVVKIDNVEPKARPQTGLNQADVVYEERVEGSVTRLLAIFHSTDSAPIGPVRSARTSDIPILMPLGRPLFAWSGANASFAQRVRSAPLVDVGYDVASSQYYRDGGRAAPSNLMLKSSADLLAAPPESSTPPPQLFQYRKRGGTTAHLEPVAGVRITYGTSAGSAPVEYRWNGKGWARWQKGTPHVDHTGLQVAPANVVIQFVQYASSGVADQFGNLIPEAQTVGEGEVWVLTKGGIVVGRWHKATYGAVTTYTDADGKPILLTPGRTWVALPQPGGGQRL